MNVKTKLHIHIILSFISQYIIKTILSIQQNQIRSLKVSSYDDIHQSCQTAVYK